MAKQQLNQITKQSSKPNTITNNKPQHKNTTTLSTIIKQNLVINNNTHKHQLQHNQQATLNKHKLKSQQSTVKTNHNKLNK